MPHIAPAPASASARPLGVQRIAICGLGLIGGSVLKALRAAGFAGHVSAWDVDPAVLRQAQAEGFLNAAWATPETLFAEHDLVVLCQPVAAVVEFLAHHRVQMQAGRAVIIDVASVKAPVLAALRDGAHAPAANMVPCHPIAGRARHGWAAAQADLFQRRLCVMTPDAHTAPQAVALAHDFWTLLGARTALLAASEHDRIYAALSHLPQVLSYAYLHSLAAREDAHDWLAYRGTGFNSFARLGASDAHLWADIAHHNAAPLIEEIDRVSASLALMRQALAEGRQGDLGAAFARARSFHAKGGLPDEAHDAAHVAAAKPMHSSA